MNEYHELIEEAYIQPIRSVIIVDDEFPTLDKFYEVDDETLEASRDRFQGSSPEEKDEKISKARERAGKIIKECRKRNWIVDVYDGSGFQDHKTIEVTKHLHQSDLLILDYELEGHGNGGELAVKTISELALSDHFNMVAVYTRETDVAKIHREICIGLTRYNPSLELSDEQIDQVADFLEDWKINGLPASKSLEAAYGEDAYFEFVRTGQMPVPNFGRYWASERRRVGNENTPSQELIVKYCLYVTQSRFKSKLRTEVMPAYTCNLEGEINWIRTNTLYVTILHKLSDASEDDVIERFIHSLYHWEPKPHRLVLSRLRYDLEEYGSVVEDRLLKDKLIQMGWYKEIIQEKQANLRRLKIKEILRKQWGNMLANLPEKTALFAEKVFAYEESFVDSEARLEKLFPETDSEQVKIQLNAYTSCLPEPIGPHLMPGHILRLEDQYFLCATPACDLVPGRARGGWFKKLGPYMPFKAVKLWDKQEKLALRGATTNEFLFVPFSDEKSDSVDVEVKCFAFRPEARKSKDDAPLALPSPSWEQLLAANEGQFSDEMKLQIARVSFEGRLVLRTCEAEVVAQLRYEYALNILQKLGSSLTRVGLDFVNDI